MKIVKDVTLVEETLIEVLQPSRKDSLHFKASPRWQLGSLALPTTRQYIPFSSIPANNEGASQTRIL
jgi:hypothetical protein